MLRAKPYDALFDTVFRRGYNPANKPGLATFREQIGWSILHRRIVGDQFEGGGDTDRSETRNS